MTPIVSSNVQGGWLTSTLAPLRFLPFLIWEAIDWDWAGIRTSAEEVSFAIVDEARKFRHLCGLGISCARPSAKRSHSDVKSHYNEQGQSALRDRLSEIGTAPRGDCRRITTDESLQVSETTKPKYLDLFARLNSLDSSDRMGPGTHSVTSALGRSC